ncbi:MAG TPA: helix-turn-helix domain-containing protein [Gemmataceae bacterium]|nr:helix-turn-helix domain-containing protein [Gemmataceae bacterium]
MPRTKKPKPTPPPQPAPPPAAVNGPAGEVFTLAEAAAYLRLSEEDVTSAVHMQNLPGRFVNGQWRFLKSAIQEWLGKPPPQYSKEAQLSVVGSWKDDPYLDEMLEEIHRQRGRPGSEEGAK